MLKTIVLAAGLSAVAFSGANAETLKVAVSPRFRPKAPLNTA